MRRRLTSIATVLAFALALPSAVAADSSSGMLNKCTRSAADGSLLTCTGELVMTTDADSVVFGPDPVSLEVSPVPTPVPRLSEEAIKAKLGGVKLEDEEWEFVVAGVNDLFRAEVGAALELQATLMQNYVDIESPRLLSVAMEDWAIANDLVSDLDIGEMRQYLEQDVSSVQSDAFETYLSEVPPIVIDLLPGDEDG